MFTRIAKAVFFPSLALIVAAGGASAQSWQGGYVGAYAGAAFGNSDVRTNALCDRAVAASLFCVNDASQANATAINAAGSGSLSPDGFTGGGLAGYNWQAGQLIYGIEGDFGTMRLKATLLGTGSYPSGIMVPNTGDPFAISTTAETSWLGTLRGRLGYSFGTFLVFASGGLAFTELKVSSSFQDREGIIPVIGVGSGSANSVKTG